MVKELHDWGPWTIFNRYEDYRICDECLKSEWRDVRDKFEKSSCNNEKRR